MSSPLDQRLVEAKTVLTDMDTILGRHPNKLPPEVEDMIRNIINYQTDIEHWLEVYQARSVAMNYLIGLEGRVDADGDVDYGNSKVKFRHARFLGTQSYIATTWGLSDRVTGFTGRILCTANSGRNDESPAELFKHFVNKSEFGKATAGLLALSIRKTYGWPIGLAYSIRNHFLHDGAHMSGKNFFDGSTPPSAFKISQDGWSRVEERALKRYKLDPSFHNLGPGWLSSPHGDLRVVLEECVREKDYALGVLLISAVTLVKAQLSVLVGEI